MELLNGAALAEANLKKNSSNSAVKKRCNYPT